MSFVPKPRRRQRPPTWTLVGASIFTIALIAFAVSVGEWIRAGSYVLGAGVGLTCALWNTDPFPGRVSTKNTLANSIEVPARRMDRRTAHAALLAGGRWQGSYAIIEAEDPDMWSVTVVRRSLLPRRPEAGLYQLTDDDLDDFTATNEAKLVRSGAYATSVLHSLGLYPRD